MNIRGISVMTVLTKFTTDSADGTKKYPKLSVLIGNEAGTLSCSEEIYNTVETGKKYEFETTYNDTYKSFKLSRVLQVAK